MIDIRDQTLTGMDVPWISAVALFDTGETEFFPDLDDAAGVERIGNGYGASKRQRNKAKIQRRRCASDQNYRLCRVVPDCVALFVSSRQFFC